MNDVRAQKRLFLGMKKLHLLLGSLLLARFSSALTFHFSYDPSIKSQVLADFQHAGQIWGSYLKNNVTVNLDIAYQNSGAGFWARLLPILKRTSTPTS